MIIAQSFNQIFINLYISRSNNLEIKIVCYHDEWFLYEYCNYWIFHKTTNYWLLILTKHKINKKHVYSISGKIVEHYPIFRLFRVSWSCHKRTYKGIGNCKKCDEWQVCVCEWNMKKYVAHGTEEWGQWTVYRFW